MITAKQLPFKDVLKSRLAKTQLVRILIFSSMITLAGTFLQLLIEYQEDMKSLDGQLSQIQATHLGSLTNSLWLLDNRQIQIHMDNLLSLRDIVYLEITEKGKPLFKAGNPASGRVKIKRFPMKYNRKQKDLTIGTLAVYASLGNVYQRLIRRIFIILVTQGMKTFLVSFFILFILYHQVIRHLLSLSSFTRQLSLDSLDSEFRLDRGTGDPPDELDLLVSRFNDMRRRLGSGLTRIRKTEQALRKSEQELRAILQATPDPLVRYDDKGFPLYINPEFTKVFGWTIDELTGSKIPFIPEDQKEKSRARINAVYESGKPVKFSSRRLTRYGESVEVIVSAAAIHESFGLVGGVVVNITDIREQRQLEAQLQQSQKMESVGRLAGGVAHDFNNMLSIIMGHTEILLEDAPRNDEFIPGIREIQQAAQRSANLVHQLLAFARKQTISPQVLDLNETTAGMLTMLQRLIGEDIRLNWIPCQTPWPVKMDPSQIDQILVNLCVNARDAVKGPGQITIETGNAALDESYCAQNPEASPGDFFMIAVSDNGCGMDRPTLDNLFEPFFTTKAVGRGTGLGLSTIYGIVRQNNGLIKVDSEPGKGTTFRIYLPRFTDTGQTPAQKPKCPPVIGGNETILLVEDEAPMLKITTQILERLGYRIIAASSPGKALAAAAAADTIDLLVTDVVMPEMNGRELADKITALFPKIKCLFMSGYTANIIAHQGILKAGVVLISKPFSSDEIAGKIRHILDAEKLPD